MKNLFLNLFIGLLLAILPLFASAQIHTASSQETHSFGGVYVPAAAPAISFRSTSTGIPVSSAPAVGFRKLSASPSINTYGVASFPNSTSAGVKSGPLRERGSGGGHTGTPGSSAGNQIPVGSPVLPMLLLMAGYVIVRKRLAQQHND